MFSGVMPAMHGDNSEYLPANADDTSTSKKIRTSKAARQ
jgi:hypothetical protein